MRRSFLLAGLFVLPTLLAACATAPPADPADADGWVTDFFDDFDTFDEANWQDQILWVNNEDQCYVRDGAHGTREVSDGTLTLRVVDLGEAVPCDNPDKLGATHPPTRYVAGRLASKNRKEFVQGRWTARLRLTSSGQPGMFPAWWLLGARNNEPPVQEADEDVCWPLTGSGEIDIFEHWGAGGPGHYVGRAIRPLGTCEDGGDWETYQRVLDTDLEAWHEYAVEWRGDDLVYLLDGAEVGRNEGLADQIAEPLFAILNYAKISDDPMVDGPWEMEVDWVRHESRR